LNFKKKIRTAFISSISVIRVHNPAKNSEPHAAGVQRGAETGAGAETELYINSISIEEVK